jgi:hypothetical protein
VGVALDVLLPLPLALPLADPAGEGVPVAPRVPEAHAEAVALAHGRALSVAEIAGEVVAQLEAVALGEPVFEPSGLPERAEGDPVAERRADGVTVSESPGDAERLAVAQREAEGLLCDDALKERAPDEEGDAEGRAEGDVATRSSRTKPCRPGSEPLLSESVGLAGSP